ncbi:MAG: hypothetical protein M3Q14_01900 [bacterium]|nr:hypothetical protein [bacterium]
MNKIIAVDEPYQSGYTYTLTALSGKEFAKDFKPELKPNQMLALGIFGGNYFQQIPMEFPTAWFRGIILSKTGSADPNLNYFKVNASQPLSEWQRKGWISEEDPKGWFLWYCRYYQGRRILEEDNLQIKRWKNMRRHVAQVQQNCSKGDLSCHRRQRQALLHWAYDSRNI